MVGWIRSYERRWLKGDLIAGVTVAALIVPKNLGYAGIAGIPLQNGLYAAAAGAILYAVFGTSRQISTGPSSGLAAVAASAVAVAGITGVQDVASFVAMITLVSGVLFLVLAVLKMGWIAQFLSRAVVTGFLFGAAIDVVIGELPKLTGTKVTGSNPLQELWSWFGTLGDASLVTVLVGAVALIVVFGLRVIAPRIPGALVLVVGGLVASWLFDLGAHGVALVGEVPRGLPAPHVPDLHLLGDHASTIAAAAVALVLIGFSQTAGDARAFAAKHHYRIDINQESAAQGFANAGAGLFQGMPVSTSLSASSLNDHAGARTGLASLTSGVTVLLTLVVLAPVFSKLPKPALEDRVREVSLSTPGITGIVLDCEGIDFIDSQGSAKMREILELTDRAGMTLRLARVKPAVREVLERDGVLERIGDDKTHGNVDQAVEAQIHAAGGSRADI
jgi:anti-anti-sigma factor